MGWFKKKVVATEYIPSAAPDCAVDSIEIFNSQKMAQKREERESKEKSLDDVKLVIDGAKIQCTLCTNPMGTLKVMTSTPTIEDKMIATVKDNTKLSLLFTGTCTKSPNAASPCAAVIQPGQWKDTGLLLVQDESPLLLKSTLMCMFGGVQINITDCGQRN